MGRVLQGVVDELAGLDLGDVRLDRRAARIVETLAAAPDASFPNATEDDTELEALYRFVNNSKVTMEALLAPHYGATAARAATEGRVLALHDTTVLSYGGETHRAGLGRIKKGGQGYSAHTCLVVRPSDGLPLGVMGVVPVVRDGALLPRAVTRVKLHDRQREFERWETLVEKTFARLQGISVVHVMDREADAYPLFCKLIGLKQDFVIRAKNDRCLDVPVSNTSEPHLVSEAVAGTEHILEREIHLSTKRPDRMARLRKVAPRMTRVAKLRAVAAHVELRHPSYTAGKSRRTSTLPRSAALNVVRLYEVDPPADQEPVEWLLYTSLPVDTAEQVGAVIDIYRRRWIIEEFFKTLKTGCAIEKRQLESKDALLNALALFIPIAWRLLALRHLARENPTADGLAALTPRQIQILRARAKRPLSATPTCREVMLAVAAEGGHIKNNGDPGWLVLGRGYEKLLYMELGFALAQRKA